MTVDSSLLKVYLYNLALAVQKLERHGERLDSYLAELEVQPPEFSYLFSYLLTFDLRVQKRTRELDFEKEGGNNVDI